MSHRFFDGTFSYVSADNGHFVRAQDGTRQSLLAQAKAVGITRFIEPGIDLTSCEKLLALSAEHRGTIHPAVGLHPLYAAHAAPGDGKKLRQLASDPHVVAIGEMGLDYHLPRNKQHRLRQWVWFIRQLRLSRKLNLPGIFHIRNADRDAIRILRLFRHCLCGGVCHCFSGDIELARTYTGEFGLLLGIGGALLRNSPVSERLEAVVREIPLTMLLLETDGPYVHPTRPPEISKRQWEKTSNTSLILPEVAQRIAELKGIPVSVAESVTTENALRLFQLSKT